jgi:hypothetical protein
MAEKWENLSSLMLLLALRSRDPADVERVNAAGRVQTRIRAVLGSTLAPDTGYPEVFHGFTQSLQINYGMLSRLRQHRFLPNPF